MTIKIFGTKEWAAVNFNFAVGCPHNCRYCYSKEMAIRFKRKTGQNWKIEKVDTSKIVAARKKYNGRVMVPSSHDITPCNISFAKQVIETLLHYGNDVLVVSKPHLECIKELIPIAKMYPEKITFRFSIGSCNDDILKFWEPGAPNFEERLECLKLCHKSKLRTSVSAEPILDNRTRELVKKIIPYVSDAIWIGIPNHLIRRLKVNGYNSDIYMKKAETLIQDLSSTYILGLVADLRENPKIKWKESIKKIAGIEPAECVGADV